MYKNLMIDTEGMSLATNAAVIQIAAIPFHSLNDFSDVHMRHTEFHQPDVPTFNERIWPGAYPCEGFDVSDSTMQFWDQQDEASRKLAFSGMNLPDTIASRFLIWVDDMQLTGQLAIGKDLRIWARNNQYDFPVLKNLIEQSALTWPFHHQSSREYYNEIDGVPKDAYAHITNVAWHDAACDCSHQIRVIQFCQNFKADRYANHSLPKSSA